MRIAVMGAGIVVASLAGTVAEQIQRAAGRKR
jgi:hypothetical protein